ncbi:hypothetical protein VC83_06147 [Pseudogymnoascus destructans]|jgi:hypothetical protein|uniref:PPPDE domain-containing protein n=2 Tax=Pseudogymnoascus destructans TaxID=655981 RepID=L8G3D0_PSED2|nr:uncharacterized protein VC83_06147 [Pseudogymnoascus destructans]ELR06486.1 hypothetical protein GMDG_08010 [Pseudogymnoascus destructans 20631-21]KFZ23534.1 hypothetical protein V502_01988 [Pseudogymnoascus sp. VKM F-4520 (FW-2644)]OAF59017.1 hypothetical protein VC83_06147 [Pseudogymnoascus destructans]
MASNSTSGPTVHYNVYIIYFNQATGPSHEGIALVPSQFPNQTAGRFYHVKGTVGMGMDYECRPGYNFGASRSYQKSSYQFQIPKSRLADFERIAQSRPPPHDPRALTERNPNPPVRDCAEWVVEVLNETKTALQGSSTNA